MAELVKRKILKIKLAKVAATALVLIFCSAADSPVKAASLYFSPSFDSKKIGSSFSVGIYVSSASESMNAASGVISYPADKLELVSLSKSGSIFSLWVDEPSWSQSAGTFHFEGIVMNPGFKGSSGKIISATFKIKSAGTAQLRFNSGAILANNGIGTNILEKLGSASFNLVEETQVEAPKPTTKETPKPAEPKKETPVAETAPTKKTEETSSQKIGAITETSAGSPLAPKIYSSTHPSQDKWFNLREAKFSWEVPADVSEVATIFSKDETAAPDIAYNPPINSKTIDSLEDGVWYFALRFKNKSGWGEIARYRINVDTLPPVSFAIKFVSGQEVLNFRPVITFETTDGLSNMDYYKVRVIDETGIQQSEDVRKSNPYMLPPQFPGRKTLFVQAYDKAGNYTTAIADFDVKGIEAPIITKLPKQLVEGELMKIEGTTFPESEITIFMKADGRESELGKTHSDTDGNFVFSYDKPILSGNYKIFARVQDKNGATSYPSIENDIKILPSKFFRVSRVTYGLIIGLAALGLIALIFFMIRGVGYKLVVARKNSQRQSKQISIAFTYLRNKFKSQIRMLERLEARRRLTGAEKEILVKTKQDLADVETAIKKEIHRFRNGL